VEINTEKVDEAVSALLYLTLHDVPEPWKGFDWDSLNRAALGKDLISHSLKATSVVLTDEDSAHPNGCSVSFSPRNRLSCADSNFP